MLPAPFKAPNQHACLALYRQQDNAWWLAMGASDYHHFEPWKYAIKNSGGLLVEHRVVSSCVRTCSKWRELHASAREKMKDGFEVMDGSLLHISPSGTRWLMSDPQLWWHMHSASEGQLQALKTLADPMHFLLGAMDRQGMLKSKHKHSPCGPSFLRARWETVFPKEMAFATQCQTFGIDYKEAKTLWLDILAQSAQNIHVTSNELSDLFGDFSP